MAAHIESTPQFKDWLNGLSDTFGRARIQARIERLALGNPGQYRALSRGIYELKIDVGPGYRVYYSYRQRTLIVLLAGGSKASQRRDIRTATRLAENL